MGEPPPGEEFAIDAKSRLEEIAVLGVVTVVVVVAGKVEKEDIVFVVVDLAVSVVVVADVVVVAAADVVVVVVVAAAVVAVVIDIPFVDAVEPRQNDKKTTISTERDKTRNKYKHISSRV